MWLFDGKPESIIFVRQTFKKPKTTRIMKKLFITLIVVVAATAFANSQTYLGGSVGIGTTGGKSKGFTEPEVEGAKSFSFEIAPRIGFYANDRLSFGVAIGYGYEKISEAGLWETQKVFSVSPYMRYAFVTLGKFQINIEGGVDFGFGNIEGNSEALSVMELSVFRYNIYVVPVLSYDISKYFSLEATLNLFGFNYYSSTLTGEVLALKATDNINGFAMGLNTDSTAVHVGFACKF
jgi:hypothetical protein